MLIYVLLTLYALWIFYLAVMNLYRANKQQRLTGFVKALGYFTLIVGAALDAFVNICIASIIFLKLPQDVLLTGRLSRYQRGNNGWRKTLAIWICRNLLNRFDPSGNHCR